jgi:isopenicillin N synthase-like dioxygenase
LDLSTFRDDPRSPAATAFVDQLRDVVHEIGFFYLVGHGVGDELNAEVHDVARAFFALPEQQRLEIHNVLSPQFRGYTSLGNEYTNGQSDLRDQIDIGLELPTPQLGPDDPAWLRLRGPNLWPSVPRFREAMSSWIAQMEDVGRVLLQAMSRALGQPDDHFDEMVTPHPELLTKVIRYPAPTDWHPSDQGVGAHRDTGFLSFIHQDAIGGLEVDRDGEFVGVPPLPGAFVVNIGEMFQLVTRGYFKATVHRVVSPPVGVERISIAFFYNPKLEATLAPIDLPPELAAKAPGGDSVDPSNPILANYGDNSLKVRLRAHPDVAERHHADLLAPPGASVRADARAPLAG